MGSYRIEEKFSLELWTRYVNIRAYPHMVSAGHLNNTYGRYIRELGYSNLKNSGCLAIYIFIVPEFRKEKWELVWARTGVNIRGQTPYYIPRTADLICNIQVSGGTFARIGNKNMTWDGEIQRWVLPELTEETPLCRLTELNNVVLETDGVYLWYQNGFLDTELRRRMVMRDTDQMWKPDWVDQLDRVDKPDWVDK